ncbi:MAG: hypothetical protein L6Q92_02085 [Phycisphaerae bacterium]|nr:hypothetical protein [Phycisphaerae bacterium]
MAAEPPNPICRRESDLYLPLLSLFSDHSRVFAEVPFFGKHIDLLFGTPTLARFYAVETKLSDWRSAFKQAALNQLAAQLSYVAVPSKLATRLAEREAALFASYDVGLIAVDGTARILIRARRNGYFIRRYYRDLKTALSHATQSQKLRNIGDLEHALAKRSRALVLLQARTD